MKKLFKWLRVPHLLLAALMLMFGTEHSIALSLAPNTEDAVLVEEEPKLMEEADTPEVEAVEEEQAEQAPKKKRKKKKRKKRRKKKRKKKKKKKTGKKKKRKKKKRKKKKARKKKRGKKKKARKKRKKLRKKKKRKKKKKKARKKKRKKRKKRKKAKMAADKDEAAELRVFARGDDGKLKQFVAGKFEDVFDFNVLEYALHPEGHLFVISEAGNMHFVPAGTLDDENARTDLGEGWADVFVSPNGLHIYALKGTPGENNRIFYRTDVTEENPMGLGWHAMSEGTTARIVPDNFGGTWAIDKAIDKGGLLWYIPGHDVPVRSEDGEMNWKRFDAEEDGAFGAADVIVAEDYVYALKGEHGENADIYVRLGISEENPYGTEWKKVDSGPVSQMTVVGDTVWAVSAAGGIWKGTFSEDRLDIQWEPATATSGFVEVVAVAMATTGAEEEEAPKKKKRKKKKRKKKKRKKKKSKKRKKRKKKKKKKAKKKKAKKKKRKKGKKKKTKKKKKAKKKKRKKKKRKKKKARKKKRKKRRKKETA